jgi:hypothetical protein
MTLKENYNQIRDLENLIINLAENGKTDFSLELKMKSLTYNFLRLTHKNLKMNKETIIFKDNNELLYCFYTEKYYPSSEMVRDNLCTDLRYINKKYVEKYLDYMQKENNYTDEEKFEHYLELKKQ